MDSIHDITKLMFPVCKRKIIKQTIVASSFILLYIIIIFFYVYPYIVEAGNTMFTLTSLITFYALLFVVPIINYIYFHNYLNLYFYNFKKDHIVIRDGFLLKETVIPYSLIQDVYINQDFLDKFLDLYDIHFSLGGKSLLKWDPHIDGIEKHAAENMLSFVAQSISYLVGHTDKFHKTKNGQFTQQT